jgi:transcriptional antiterminator RfaH
LKGRPDQRDAPPEARVPILSAEPDRFPADLFEPADADMPDSAGAWWVLHSKPRQEKSLARHLHSAGVPFFLPTISRRARIRGRVLTSRLPLFTGYVFLHADAAGRLAALTSNRVARCLAVPDQGRFWDDLRQVDRLLSSGAPVTPEERLAVGSPVEITSGPLAGLSGVIVRTATGRRFVVRVDFIQQGASVLIDDFALVPLDGGRTAVR